MMLETMRARGRYLGWAFLLAWVFCVFYSRPMDGYFSLAGGEGTSAGPLGELAVNILPVATAVIVLAAIVFGEQRWGEPAENRAWRIAAPLLTSIATPLLFVHAPQLWSFAPFVLGSALVGLGSGVLWVMWGNVYARLPLNETEWCTPVSAVLAGALSFAITLLPPQAAFFAAALFPAISGILLCSALSQIPDSNADSIPKPVAPSALRAATGPLGRSGFGILIACFFVSIEGSFDLIAPSVPSPLKECGIFLAGVVFTLAIATFATALPRRVSLTFAYRWMCPLAVVGYVALIVLPPESGAYIASVVATAARFAFCIITQMYFAAYASSGAVTSTQAFGLGWIFVHAGDLLGVIASTAILDALKAGSFPLASASAVLIALFITAVMFVLNDHREVLGWQIAKVGMPDNGEEGHAAPIEESSVENAPTNEQGSMESRVMRLAEAYGLTKRETEVFALLAQGRSIPYVRDALYISRDTAATHAKHIYTKLDVHSRQELIDLVVSDHEA